MKRRSRINPISKKRRQRSGVAGKLGIVRLYGEDLKRLREAVYLRDEGRCQFIENGVKCNKWLPLDGTVFQRAHMAHIGSKRLVGDALETTRVLCYTHHIVVEHGGGKPCPPKPKPEDQENAN